MKLSSIVEHMNAWAPDCTSEAWDNVGLQIAPKGDIPVQSIVVALDVDAEVLTYISNKAPDLVITHHPLIFKGLRSVQQKDPVGKAVINLIQHGTSLFSAHTNLDKADGGVNHALLEFFGLPGDIGQPFQGDIGVQIDVKQALDSGQVSAEQVNMFHKTVEEWRTKGTWVGDKSPATFNKVGFCGGSGKSLLQQVYDNNLDLFITGELGYHDEVYVNMMGRRALLMGHKESEVPVLSRIVRRLEALSDTFSIEVIS